MARPMTNETYDTPHATSTNRHPSQWLALLVGLAFVAAGVAGFVVTGFDDFASRNTDETLFGLEINGLHNVVHLVIGIAGLLLWRTLAGARSFGWLLAIGYAAAFVFGLFAVDEEDINILSLNDADNWFHLASALVGLVIALWPRRHDARRLRA